jgi:hypothetical protein
MVAIMKDVEKHELFEQERKIFEAGAQRVDKRTGSFSFLTWPFFIAIAPLVASEQFLAATFKSAAAAEGDAKAAQAGVAPQAADDDPPASDLSKSSAEDETAKGPAASSDAHAAELDFLAQPHDDVRKPTAARDQAVADASAAGRGGDGADFRHHDAHTSMDGSSVNSLSADSHFGSSPFPGGSTLESIQSGDSFSPALTNDVAGTIAPVEAVQPVLATVTDSVSTLSNDVAGAIAPVEAVQPVLATVTDSVSTLSNDVAGTIAPVEAVQPVLATVTDSVGSLSNDVTGAIAPVEAVQPEITTVTDSVGTLSHDEAGASAPVETGQPVRATVTDSASTLSNDEADTSAPANAVTDVSNAAAADDSTAIAGDVIALNDEPPPQENALFNGTQYTDYGVTLSSDIAIPPQHAVSPDDAASAQDTLVPVVADIQQQAPTAPDIVDTTASIDHLGLRDAVL